MEKYYKFYVIDDLNKNVFNIKRFDKEHLDDALVLFLNHPSKNGEMPAFGIENQGYSLDILHGVNGADILVTDYRMKDALSSPMKSIYDDIEAIVDELLRKGVVEFEYNKDKSHDGERFKSIDKLIDDAVKTAKSAGIDTGNKEINFERE